jgi:hypothetical protein
MAKKTNYLQLILPALGEYFNRWNEPVNANFQKIDDEMSSVGQEIIDARGGSETLADRLSSSLNDDGSLKDVPEVAAARSSKIYGSGDGGNFFTLDDRLEAGDLEVLTARQGLSALADSQAWAQDDTPHNCLVNGPSNPLTFSGAVVTLNGGTTPVVSNINGYRSVTSIQDAVTVAGAAGTYYLYLDRNPTGRQYYQVPDSAGTTGLMTSSNKLSKFSASSTNLIASGVKVGHILEVTAPAGNLNVGRWVVAQTAAENPDELGNNEVRIVGEFASSSTGISAQFIDTVAPSLGFTSTPPSKTFQRLVGRVYIGRAVFDGTNVTSLVSYAYQARYAGFTSVSLVSGDFNQTIQHALGVFPRRVHVYASQKNDFTAPLEPLSIAKTTQGAVAISSGSQTITYTPPGLRRSVIVRFDDTTISIKNATNGIFYEDFDGNAQTTGFLFVVVER